MNRGGPSFTGIGASCPDAPRTSNKLRNSQAPPAADVARRELITRSGFDLASQVVSDQEPTNVCSALRAEPDASSSSALKSHLSSLPMSFVALKSRRAERETASQLAPPPLKNPNSLR